MSSISGEIYNLALRNGGVLTYAQIIDRALYSPEHGYYRGRKTRVGAGGDFFTAASLKRGVFGRAVECAAANILRAGGEDPRCFEFVEIGAEPEAQALPNARAIRLGEEISLSGNLVVFANELPDARPSERFVFDGEKWRKAAFKFGASLEDRREILIDASEAETETLLANFAAARVKGFSLDISADALRMFANICAQPWRGAIIFADYFRTAAELAALPSGTLRTYFRHRQGGDIFENIGAADITHSPCSDLFESAAKKFSISAQTMTQEKFILTRAADFAEKIISRPGALDPQKRELCQLVNPAQMGACFRVLFGARL